MNIIDRRLNPNGKSLPNRQRFMRLAKDTIKEAVVRSIRERALGDVERTETVNIPMKRIAEPRFRLSQEGGDRERVFPGNKEFTQGDLLPKPKQGGGEGRGSEGSPDGEGDDDFQFTLTAEEYLDILFEELELPDLVKLQLKNVAAMRPQRSGHSISGAPSNLNLVRTMRQSLARRISLSRPSCADAAEVAAEIAALEAKSPRTPADDEALAAAQAKAELIQRRSRRIAYIDPVDLRYNRFEQVPKPIAQAVMFCLMDVSGSMNEAMKDLAKRFFLLLHLFLSRRYEKVDIVFIRHTSEAREVDEETFFRGTDTGGTVVSSALEEMRRIIEARYSPASWNIYAAQASDGDNYSSDNALCIRLLEDELLPICQYFAYIEVVDPRQAEIFLSGANASGLWRDYDNLSSSRANFVARRVFSKADVFPVFHQLFAKTRSAA
jgi:uncharacterized sporulation protein YeaH/YhbH (DUF444 family)